MPSIRRTLAVYVLSLFATAIGGVGLLVDRLVSDTLTARLAVAEEQVRGRFRDRVDEAREKRDEQMLTHARLLGRAMQASVGYQFEQDRQRFGMVATLVAFTDPGPRLAAGLWAGQVFDFRSPVFRRLIEAYFANLHLNPDFVPSAEGRDKLVFQINVPYSRPWRSESLGDDALPFDLRQYETQRMALWEPRFEDGVLLQPSGRRMRRVVVKTPVLLEPQRRGFIRPPGSGDRDRPPGDRPPTERPSAARSGTRPPPALPPDQLLESIPRIYVMAATPMLPYEQEFAEEIDRRDSELAARQAEYRLDLARVRGYLFGIAAAGFVAVAVGGALLVRRGLKPVDRLSDAVGRVSERDFRLPVAPAQLSRELLPIHDRLTATLDQLRAAFEREKQAVADISHELRTPVAALLTTIDVSLRKPRSAEQYRETLTECRGLTKQLGQLVERVMTLAYLDAGQAQMAAIRVEAGELAAEAAAVVKPLAAAHGLIFKLDAPDVIEVDTDPDKLREVLTNLLHNAVEYNQPGGTVELTVRAKAGRAVFAVRDTGIGMTPEVAGRVFERFFRADPSRTQTGVHAGLGLAIVKEYVDRLGGTIRVTSEPGQGSTFTVELPGAEVREAVEV